MSRANPNDDNSFNLARSRPHVNWPVSCYRRSAVYNPVSAQIGDKQLASTFTNLIFHIVYSTKYRKSTIDADVRERLYEYMGGIIREQKGVQLEIGGMPDHVHILAKLSPTIAISDALRDIKANSSKWMNETIRPSIPFAWQRGFGAFSVSQSHVDLVTEYIRNQAVHHEKRSFKDEFIQLLQRHGIEFDRKYVFEDEHIA